MKFRLSKFIILLGVFIPGVTMAVLDAEYVLESKTKNYEIRKYNETIVAETKVNSQFDEAGNKAFRILASYIFGNNISKSKIPMSTPVIQQIDKVVKSEKIPMTAPVSQIKTAGGYRVQFTMPSNYNLENLPKPNDPKVKILKIPARRVAVFKYSGSWSRSRFQKKLKKFKSDLSLDKVETEGEPIFARYNSPFQLWFLRRNEIWLDRIFTL